MSQRFELFKMFSMYTGSQTFSTLNAVRMENLRSLNLSKSRHMVHWTLETPRETGIKETQNKMLLYCKQSMANSTKMKTYEKRMRRIEKRCEEMQKPNTVSVTHLEDAICKKSLDARCEVVPGRLPFALQPVARLQ